MLWRYPEGVDRQGWFQAAMPEPPRLGSDAFHRRWNGRAPRVLPRRGGSDTCLAGKPRDDRVPSPRLAGRPAVRTGRPDLRPRPRAACRIGRLCRRCTPRPRERLEADGLLSVVKTSGRAGSTSWLLCSPGTRSAARRRTRKGSRRSSRRLSRGTVIARSVRVRTRRPRLHRLARERREPPAGRTVLAPRDGGAAGVDAAAVDRGRGDSVGRCRRCGPSFTLGSTPSSSGSNGSATCGRLGRREGCRPARRSDPSSRKVPPRSSAARRPSSRQGQPDQRPLRATLRSRPTSNRPSAIHEKRAPA